MVRVQGVARSAIVGIPGSAILQDIVYAVLQPLEAESGASVVALSGMIIDHIQDDLDTGPVQGLDHVAELVQNAQGILA
jgi:hypothetical protein